MGKTINQIAIDCGVSKTAIKKKITKLGLDDKLVRDAHAFLVNPEEENLIRESYGLPKIELNEGENTDNQIENRIDNQSETDNQKPQTSNRNENANKGYCQKPPRRFEQRNNIDNQSGNYIDNQSKTDNQSETMKQLTMVIEMLRQELSNKQAEIEMKNKQIQALNERLKESQELQKGSQVLQANAEQKILALEAQHDEEAAQAEKKKKHWWTFWK